METAQLEVGDWIKTNHMGDYWNPGLISQIYGDHSHHGRVMVTLYTRHRQHIVSIDVSFIDKISDKEAMLWKLQN